MLVLYNIGNFSVDIAKSDDIGLCGCWKEWEVLLDLEKLLGCVGLNLQRVLSIATAGVVRHRWKWVLSVRQ